MARKPPDARGLPPNEGLQFSFRLGAGSDDVAAAAASLRATVEGTRRRDDAEIAAEDRERIAEGRERLLTGPLALDRAIYRRGYGALRVRVERAAKSEHQPEEVREEMLELLLDMNAAERRGVRMRQVIQDAPLELEEARRLEEEARAEGLKVDDHFEFPSWRKWADRRGGRVGDVLEDERLKVHVVALGGDLPELERIVSELAAFPGGGGEADLDAGDDREAGPVRSWERRDQGMSM